MSKKRRTDFHRFPPEDEYIIRLMMEANNRSRLPRFITLINDESEHHDIRHDDIVYAFWNNDRTVFVLQGKRLHIYHLNESLDKVEELLDSSNFIRASSHLFFNRLAVHRVEWDKMKIFLADDYDVTFTRSYSKLVAVALKEFLPEGFAEKLETATHEFSTGSN